MEALKFLVVPIKSGESLNFMVLSFYKLLQIYSNGRVDNAIKDEDYIMLYEDNSDYWTFNNTKLSNNMQEAFNNNEINKFKQYVFGDLDVELYINSVVLSTTYEGKVIAVNSSTGSYRIKFKECDGEPLNSDSKYEKLRVKHRLIGNELKIYRYSAGIVCMESKDLRYIDLKDCIVAGPKLLNLKGAEFNDLHIMNNGAIIDSINMKIGRLVQSSIVYLRGSSININWTVISNILDINRCKLSLGRVVTSAIGEIRDSEIEIDSAYGLVLAGNIYNSKLIFNCEIIEDSLRTYSYESSGQIQLYDTIIQFKGDIDMMVLRELSNKLSFNDNTSRIIINTECYKRYEQEFWCKMQHIQDGGQ